MSRRYDDQVEVRRRDDVPAEFLWRGRFYVVRDVLDTWVETPPWWRTPAARSVYGIGPDAQDVASSAELSASPVPSPAPSAGTCAPTGLALDEGEREVWRVEASAGRLHGTGVFDLSFDWSTGGWALRRAMD